MSQLVVVVALLIGVLVATLLLDRRRRENERPPRWGEPVDRPRDLEALARAYGCRPHPPKHAVGERAWRDLSLDAVFARVDRCCTSAGQLALYRRLREPSLEVGPLRDLERRIEAFVDDEPLRDACWRALTPLGKASALAVAPLLYGKPPPLARGARWLPLVTLATFAAAVASLVWPVAVLVLLGCIVVSIAARVWLHDALGTHAVTLAALAPLLAAAERLATLECGALREEVQALGAALCELRGYRSSMSWLTLETLRMNELTATLVTYLNVFFLLDVQAYVRSVALIQRRAPALVEVLETVGELDAARAIACFRAGTPTTCASFTPRGSPIVAQALVHPLVSDAVPNDVRMHPSRGWLVMGSNMSGKSTFLRAVAVNACLAQSIGCVTAQSYSAPLLQVRTLMHVEDDLSTGQSHFLAEARAARAMLSEPVDGGELLCVVDELFRGTNTADRVATAAAVLRALNEAGAFTLAATHDSELVSLLSSSHRPHYFQESVAGSALTFDYRLREGPVAPRNALAVLELVGFPPEVVADARALLG